jgi:hypothetical protein
MKWTYDNISYLKTSILLINFWNFEIIEIIENNFEHDNTKKQYIN